MSDRTKMLARLILWAALLTLGIFALRSFLLKPLKTFDQQIVQLRSKLRSHLQDRQAFLEADTFIRKIDGKTFGSDADTAAAIAGAMLTEQIPQLGLREADFTRIPIGVRKMAGALEIGWTIQGEGPLQKIIDLLYVLENDSRLHRLENVVLTPGNHPGRVRIRFRFLTVVLYPSSGGAATNVALARLDSDDRKVYDSIIARDLFRPYVPRTENEPAAVSPPVEAASAPTSPDLSQFKIVSLSSWDNAPEVHVHHFPSKETKVYKPGEALLDGQVVSVDYRSLPMPGKPGLLSTSRVILKIGDQLWAVERGQTLAERRLLTAQEWPGLLESSTHPIP